MPEPNIPLVKQTKDLVRFAISIKNLLDIWAGKIKTSRDSRVLRLKDLEKLGIDLDRFENSSKQDPYTL